MQENLGNFEKVTVLEWIDDQNCVIILLQSFKGVSVKHSRIDRFNFVANGDLNLPKEEILKKIQNQCTYLLEEVAETQEAAKAGDITEVLDGVVDIWYVAGYLQTLLESLGVNVHSAFLEVCSNNDEKFTTSLELAEKWKAQKDFPCYISETVYNGETYYMVRREDNDKVTKYDDFPKVDLTSFIPKEILND